MNSLSAEARHDLESMPYTPPEVILHHVGPLWRAFLAAEARIADLLRQIDTMAGAIVRNLPPSLPTEPEETRS